ncbi:hypothetical protein JKG68_10715 [Microvirga aerilata]|uniref:Uncharacterized protein n=1 Tax=Microvirga aerilata TaxID=670292 RepID=A0A936ZB29_9HYPH|nr:hypothetical protein [Microvirga aerilata]MBL0404440.1 hypothetical protein [Microvirga aerilata]
MQIITTRRELLGWLSKHLLEVEPLRPMDGIILQSYQHIIKIFQEDGELDVDRTRWSEQIDQHFLALLDTTSTIMLPEAVLGFMSDIFGRAINGAVPIEETIELLIQMLDFKDKYVQFERGGKTRYVVSTGQCVRRLKTTFRVTLRHVNYAYGGGRDSDDRLRYGALWWREGQ